MSAELYHSGQCKLFITTGCVCRDTPFGCIPESQALTEYLINAGVPADCILSEDCATTTYENMTFSQKSLLNALEIADFPILHK